MSEKNQPTHEQIQQRAYELYLERGGEHGSDEDDWLAAEQQLKELEFGHAFGTEDFATEYATKAQLGTQSGRTHDGDTHAQLGTQTENRSASREKNTTSVGFPSPVSFTS